MNQLSRGVWVAFIRVVVLALLYLIGANPRGDMAQFIHFETALNELTKELGKDGVSAKYTPVY